MWRIGRLARMTGVSERTLRHYDAIGLLPPAAVSPGTGYRWYGAAELTRLERIRGLRRLGLSLSRIAELADAPDARLRAALTETVAGLRTSIAELTAAVQAAEDRLADPSGLLPQRATVGARTLRVRRGHVGHPSGLAALCGDEPARALLTWLPGAPAGGFDAAVTVPRGEPLTLPGRAVVRAVVPAGAGLVASGRALFGWVDRHGLAVDGPTLEEHLVDGDGGAATVLEIPVRRSGEPGWYPARPSDVPERSTVKEQT
ncbi:MerR family transcriptional regulator [Catenuloplanes atrovinosus]|uniref:DNA-binding transcriptional MerR regulator n=1 Tax=Catenuloplanes atrovinosus TaxID=137266 RepID=A0AAE4C9Z3_9ACTN|nr:helix-turn-helix domain-containing protein [Catenuloplanes atrovinosus]MDR7275309.1 DNA-binding transcriptional MerR regulator [Catenuloplanes atrovinosus]